jgi:tetratricopeptide (TPR) repeat protein
VYPPEFRVRLLLTILLVLSPEAWAQAPGHTSPGQGPLLQPASPTNGQVVVRVRGEGGAPLSVFAIVRIFSNFTSFQQSSSTHEAAQVAFAGVPVGEYQIEVRAPGYEDANEEVSLLTPGTTTYAFVNLRPEGKPGAPPPSGPPVLAPKAQKELEAAAAALHEKNFSQARDHLAKAQKLAPGHPDVYYLRGLLGLLENKAAEARAALERAVNIDPAHFAAQSALGTLLYSRADYKAGILALEKAVQLQPQSWQSHRSLALCYFHEQSYEKARAHTERALEISGNKVPELQLLLARVWMAMQQFEKAQELIANFVMSNPTHPDLAEARRLMAELKPAGGAGSQPANAPVAAAPAAGDISSATARLERLSQPVSASAGNRGETLADIRSALPEVSRPRARGWAPAAVDDTRPVINANVACSLTTVLAGAGRRASELAENLERISAAERVELADLDADGKPHNIHVWQYNYLVSISEVRPGILAVEEDRRPLRAGKDSQGLVSRGLGAFALILHPYYANDFDMKCEGMTEWQGKAAWSVYFQQHPAPAKGFRVYATNKGRFEVLVKGRVWIGASNYEILRLETDLVRPIEAIALDVDHLVIDYRPVDFKTKKVRLWLPAKAHAYLQLAGHRRRFEHSFRDYMIFSVDVAHQEETPKP